MKAIQANNKTTLLQKLRWIIPVLLGMLFAMGDDVAANAGNLGYKGGLLYIHMLIYVLLFIIVFWLIDKGIAHHFETVKEKNDSVVQESKLLRFCHQLFLGFNWNIKSYIRIVLSIAVCWAPDFALLYPGVYWSDTSTQLIQYYGGEALTDHHPYLDTLIFGWFSDLGRTIFRSESAGLFCLVLLQAIAAILLFSVLILQIKRFGTNKNWCLGTLVFVALFPFFPVMFASLAKDTINAVFFMAFIFLWSEAFRCNGKCFNNVFWLIGLFIVSVLCALTKKTAVYVIVLSLVLLIVVFHRGKLWIKTGGLTIAVALIALVIMPKVVLPAVGVQPGGKQEGIATLIQQVGHDVIHDDGSMSDEDKKIIDGFLSSGYENIPSLYNFEIVDGIKGRSVKDESLYDDFIVLWARKTIENPIGHFEAWLGLTHGWFGFNNADGSPNYLVVCTESSWYYEPVLQYVDWPQQTQNNLRARNIYTYIQTIPVVNILFYRSFWATLAPTFCLFWIFGQKNNILKKLVYFSPILLFMFTLMLVPVSGMGGEPTRYVLQTICTLPFIFAVLISCYKKQLLKGLK